MESIKKLKDEASKLRLSVLLAKIFQLYEYLPASFKLKKLFYKFILFFYPIVNST